MTSDYTLAMCDVQYSTLLLLLLPPPPTAFVIPEVDPFGLMGVGHGRPTARDSPLLLPSSVVGNDTDHCDSSALHPYGQGGSGGGKDGCKGVTSSPRRPSPFAL